MPNWSTSCCCQLAQRPHSGAGAGRFGADATWPVSRNYWTSMPNKPTLLDRHLHLEQRRHPGRHAGLGRIARPASDIEHIFVDGGSTDATLDMIDAYPRQQARAARRQRRHQPRHEPGHRGTRSGEFIAHLHSDDYYSSDDVLAQQWRERLRGRPAADWLFGSIQVLKDGAPAAAAPMRIRSATGRWRRARPSLPHPAVFVRKAAVRAGRRCSIERLKYAMDIDLWLRLGAVARPATLDAHAGRVPRPRRQRLVGQQAQGAPGRIPACAGATSTRRRWLSASTACAT